MHFFWPVPQAAPRCEPAAIDVGFLPDREQNAKNGTRRTCMTANAKDMHDSRELNAKETRRTCMTAGAGRFVACSHNRRGP